MSRSYKGVRPHSKRVYDVAEICRLYAVHANTVSNWVGAGLRPSDGQKPFVFQGAELRRFHRERARPARPLPDGAFYCFGCKTAVVPDPATVAPLRMGDDRLVGASCPACGTALRKLRGGTGGDSGTPQGTANTTPGPADEGIAPPAVGVVRGPSAERAPSHRANDRLLHRWQIYAGKYDPKTVEAHLTAIREFEAFVDGRPFDTLTPEDVARYRDRLIARGGPSAPGALGKSTIRHRASHLRSFLAWLVQQDGYRRLNRTLPAYVDLPRHGLAAALAPPPKPYPSIDGACAMVAGMAGGTLVQRRARAIVALAFVAGLRADALISLRRRHLDLAARCVVHDARAIRAKNGKSFTIFFFPRTEPLEDIVRAWVHETADLGFGDDDALFPTEAALSGALRGEPPPRADPMRTAGAVTAAFQAASAVAGTSYTPHSARHCLADLGRRIARPPFETKAWSDNLGHASDHITDRHYGKIRDDDRRAAMQRLAAPARFTEEEKDLMLDYHSHRLVPGTATFAQAEALADRHKRAGASPVIED